jgi:hypothetical protein
VGETGDSGGGIIDAAEAVDDWELIGIGWSYCPRWYAVLRHMKQHATYASDNALMCCLLLQHR